MNETYTDLREALTEALNVANDHRCSMWVVSSNRNPGEYEIVLNGWMDHDEQYEVEPATGRKALERLIARHIPPETPDRPTPDEDKTRAPRELYRVTVDVDGWIAADPAARRAQRTRCVEYRSPVHTASRTQVSAILGRFGADHVTVECADITGLHWAGTGWPRKGPLPVEFDGRQARCPHCGGGNIVEIDSCTRENDTEWDADGYVSVSQAAADFWTLRFECRSCRGEITLPADFQATY